MTALVLGYPFVYADARIREINLSYLRDEGHLRVLPLAWHPV